MFDTLSRGGEVRRHGDPACQGLARFTRGEVVGALERWAPPFGQEVSRLYADGA